MEITIKQIRRKFKLPALEDITIVIDESSKVIYPTEMNIPLKIKAN